MSMSSLMIVPSADASGSIWIVEASVSEAPLNVTVKSSSSSTSVSPETLTVIVAVASLGKNVTVPVGKLPPKSSASASVLLTVYVAVVVPVNKPVRVTVKVNAVVPLLPSSNSASSAAIVMSVSSLTIVTVPVSSVFTCVGSTVASPGSTLLFKPGVMSPKPTVNVSSGSTTSSAKISTVINCISPAMPSNVSTPVITLSKSSPPVAEPLVRV